ncbi:MAG: capsule biosynthesis protein [Cytophagales bacterium CG12_big_fil_rev_8_21_14_0_65_40_12]|nr:MAG: capsule biosynthesis protein [Cytophagales bacterium CG12_big_fil_rev_8_21_14_0_65_40_12]PIW04234.1 MAG: capsule biosynthesis protein [Cytophagales bacterium CG17_big_fil_post_rev_8_21_14_2_50_40_13]
MKQILLSVCFFLALSNFTQAQTLPDFSNLNVSELSDKQIQSLLQRATAMGYSQSDIFELARQQGVSLSDISLLGERINRVNTLREAKSSGSPLSEDRFRDAYSDSLLVLGKRETDIFGLNFFRKNSQFLTFTPSINTPTPEDYVLSAGDEIYIDIYGASEQYYQSGINPDGNVILQNIGPISLSGLTIKQAETKIKSKLSSLYTDLMGDQPRTFLDVSLGKTRSIQVSIVGEVELPGTYNLSAFSTVFNSLYVSGGITENGTLREIKVIRNGKPIAEVDVYDFLVNGISESNIRLENDDVIIVGPYTNRITLNGAVKVAGRFELKKEESLADLLKYAGGFNEFAFQDQINVTRNVGKERVVADVYKAQYDLFNPKPGDVYDVKAVLDRFANRVQVKGAVFRPGNYSITDGLTVKQLIERADGLKGDANLGRAIILRSNPDLTTQTISIDLAAIINGSKEDLALRREDILQVFSIYDLQEEQYVEISGQVNDAGIFAYSEYMTVEDLLVMSGGFKASASQAKIEITRRFGNAEQGNLSEVFVVDVNLDLSLSAENSNFQLKPFDHVVVRRNPDFVIQKFVSVEGQVTYPGEYAITNQSERISDLLERAGGINQYAYVDGATLLRKTEFFEDQTDMQARIAELENLLKRYEAQDGSLSEAELAQVERINQQLASLQTDDTENKNLSSLAKRERLQEIVQRNTLFGDVKLNASDAIGINLKAIIENPKSGYDLILQEGDVLIIPKKQETVRLRGRVLYPTTVVYENSRSAKYFINQAGGFSNRAQKKNTYVIYANGSVAKTKRFLFFKTYPNVEPGAEIIIPAKPPKLPVAISEIVGITSGLATLALLISQINF